MSIIFRDDTRPASLLDYKVTQLVCKADRCEQGRYKCPCPEVCGEDGEPGVSVRAVVFGFVGSALIVASLAGCIALLGMLP